MTEVNPAGWFQNLATHTAEQMRGYLGAHFAVPSAAASLKTLGAVHPGLGTALVVTQNGTPNMSVNVGAGVCFIAGSEASKQGSYICMNDATVNKAITASDPTLNRIDLVVAKIQDAAYSGVTNAWSLAVVTGTPAGSPAVPAAPANSITLAQIAVNANVTSITTGNITDKRPWNAALGGATLCTSAARPAVVYNGMLAYELDTGRLIKNNGSAWSQIGTYITTSSSRPASPVAGTEIYETDTGLFMYYTGSAWRMRDPWRKTITVGSATPTVTLDTYPSILRRMKIIVSFRSDSAFVGSDLYLRLNNSASALYAGQRITSNNAVVSGATTLNGTLGQAGVCAGSSAFTGQFGMSVINIDNLPGTGNRVNWTWNSGVAQVFTQSGYGMYDGSLTTTSIVFYPFSGNVQVGSTIEAEGWDIG